MLPAEPSAEARRRLAVAKWSLGFCQNHWGVASGGDARRAFVCYWLREQAAH